MNQSEFENNILKSWENPEHVRLRTAARVTDVDYFHFFDLYDFIRRNATEKPIKILDYGAGPSPYQTCFPGADYRKADVIAAPGLHYCIRPDSTVPESDGVFDLVLSTQVVEHVANPQVYFSECFRLLRKGGKLVLTTHGVWEEHGVPYDFQRWTEQGMRRDLKQAGFHQPEIYKLTCGFRALMFLFTRTYFEVLPPAPWLPQKVFKSIRFIYSKLFPLIYRTCGKYWPQAGVVKAVEGSVTSPFYIVIAAVAEKTT